MTLRAAKSVIWISASKSQFNSVEKVCKPEESTTQPGKCSECGFVNKDGSKFCEECGTKI